MQLFLLPLREKVLALRSPTLVRCSRPASPHDEEEAKLKRHAVYQVWSVDYTSSRGFMKRLLLSNESVGVHELSSSLDSRTTKSGWYAWDRVHWMSLVATERGVTTSDV